MKWRHIAEDWLKSFVAGSVAVLIAGNYDVDGAIKAGLAAMLPLVYTWANTRDTRYGRR